MVKKAICKTGVRKSAALLAGWMLFFGTFNVGPLKLEVQAVARVLPQTF